MVIGIVRITLAIHDSHSLKEKRQVLKSIMEKVKGRFNVSISEVGDNDMWQRATIGIAAVGTDGAFVNSAIDKTVFFIESLYTAEIIDRRMELINC